MRVLVHSPEPNTTPVGVWSLPKHQSYPQGEYLDSKYYTAGAQCIFGDEGGQVFTLANWDHKIDQLTQSTSPIGGWAVFETTKQPIDFLLSLM